MAVTVDDVLNLMRTYAVPAELVDRLDPAASMAMQGVDSLALTLVAMGLQHAYGIQLTVEEGLTLRTVEDVVVMLNNRLGTD